MFSHTPDSTLPPVATVLLAIAPLVLASATHFALMRLLHWRRLQAPQQVGTEPPGHEMRAHAWLAHLLPSAALPVAVIVWILAVHFSTATLLGVLSANERPNVIAGLEWIRGTGVCLAIFWLLLRVGKVIQVQLTALADRTSSQVDDIVLPLIGKGIRIVLPLLALMLGTSALEVSAQTRDLLRDATSLLIIAAISFFLLQTVDAVQEYFLLKYPLVEEDNYRSRAIHTQVRMLRRLAIAVICTLTFGSMLMVFDSVRRFGTTILASAGVAGVVIGFAAQRSIATLLAGFQIALTQPIRIDDVVIVEGEWGRIEEITLTYVVVKIWDLRRLVLPITYFIEKPFQNWTRKSTQIVGSVFFYLDYSVPIDALRSEFIRVVQASSLWDKEVCNIQVTDAREKCMEIRGLVSASNSSHVWDLRCEVREKLLSWVATEYPHALPTSRVMLDGGAELPEGLLRTQPPLQGNNDLHPSDRS